MAILHHLPPGVPRPDLSAPARGSRRGVRPQGRSWKLLARLAAALAILLASSVAAQPALAQATSDALAEVRIDKCRRETGRVIVTYHLVGALRPEDRKDLESGQTLTFTHRIDIYRRRAFFSDKGVGRRNVETSATLDTLTGQYTLKRSVEGVVETRTTEKASEIEKWLCEVRNLPIELSADENRGVLEVRVTTKYRKTFLLFVWPYEMPAKGSGECR